MSDFKREERYIVVKLKNLTKIQELEIRNELVKKHIPTVKCVVVEADWAMYDDVWTMIEKDYNDKKARYHEPTSCNNCGGENDVIWVSIENGFLSEGRTNCKDCGHSDLWSYGFFASSDTIDSKCKTYTV